MATKFLEVLFGADKTKTVRDGDYEIEYYSNGTSRYKKVGGDPRNRDIGWHQGLPPSYTNTTSSKKNSTSNKSNVVKPSVLKMSTKEKVHYDSMGRPMYRNSDGTSTYFNPTTGKRFKNMDQVRNFYKGKKGAFPEKQLNEVTVTYSKSKKTTTKTTPSTGAQQAQRATTQSRGNTTQSTSRYTPVNRSSGATSSNGNYTIQQGDSLSAIAKRYGTTVSNLQKWNGITDANRIYAGKKLITQSPTAGQVVDIDLSQSPEGYRMSTEQLLTNDTTDKPIKAKTPYDSGQFDLGVDTGKTYKYSKGGKLRKRKSRIIDLDL